jgi:outer membrane protein OmpU
MKKVLFGTTALVAVGLCAPIANAAEPIKLTVGGMMNQFFGIAFAESDDFKSDAGNSQVGIVASPALHSHGNFGVLSDTEIHFKGSTVLDNGLKVAVVVEAEAERTQATANARNTDQQYVEISGGWGALRVGETFNVAHRIHQSAPGAGMAFADLGAFIFAVGGNSSGGTGNITTTANFFTSADGIGNAGRNSNQIDYVTPAFATPVGTFTAGVSLAPSVSSRGVPVDGTNSKDLMVGGLAYSNTIFGVAIAADAGYGRYELPATSSATQLSGMAQIQQYGLNLGYAGFKVGGSYMRIMDSNSVKGATVGAHAITAASMDGSAWDAGINYTTGPYTVGYQYFASSFEGIIGIKGKDKTSLHLAGAQYTMGPGVVLTGNFGHARYKDEVNIDSTNTSGWVVATGVKLTF